MSTAGSTSNLPPTTDAVAPRQSERLPEDVSEETSDADVLWVDWDGPGDPMNPKKWVVRLLFVQIGDERTVT